MLDLLLILAAAVLWAWLLQRIAERRAGAPLTTPYPALSQRPYLGLWIVGCIVAALIIWRL